MSPGRLLWLARRDLARGWSATYHDYFVAKKITAWRKKRESIAGQACVPVRVLTSASDFVLAAWMLASWEYFTGRRWPVFFHADATLTKTSQDWLRGIFPEATVIGYTDANRTVDKALEKLPQCKRYRQTHPLAQKIFDMAVLSQEPRYIVLDSDVLFFQKPKEILNWVDQDDGGSWFNRDVAEACLVSAQQAQEKLGVKVWEKINSGICLVQKSAIDLDFCERCFNSTTLWEGKPWRIEQTLFALCASRNKTGGLLPDSYEVSLGQYAAAGAVARHYVGAVRDRFYGEGMVRLKSALTQTP